MTNAVFTTEPLPLKGENSSTTEFETALCEYFAFYSPSRTAELVARLRKYDFTPVKANFIASVPGKFEGDKANKWGLGGLQKILKTVETRSNTELFAQV